MMEKEQWRQFNTLPPEAGTIIEVSNDDGLLLFSSIEVEDSHRSTNGWVSLTGFNQPSETRLENGLFSGSTWWREIKES